MEFIKTSINGYEMTVVFTGKLYVFFNTWCGIAAVAERTTPIEKWGRNDGAETFTIKCGNHHLLGGSCSGASVVAGVKRVVNKNENSYIKKDCEYNVENVDLSQYYALLEVKPYKR